LRWEVEEKDEREKEKKKIFLLLFFFFFFVFVRACGDCARFLVVSTRSGDCGTIVVVLIVTHCASERVSKERKK
jgi:hypothetical protein